MENFNPLDHFGQSDNSLLIGDFKITDIAELGYQTPLYIYSKEVIKNKLDSLRNLFSPEFKIYYSIKANPFNDLILYIRQYVDGYDVSSLYELDLALATGIPGRNVCFTGPGKSNHEIQIAIKSDVIISAESKIEIERIIKLGNDLKLSPKVIVRVNPNFTQRRAGMKMASGSSPFGIDEELLPDLIRWIDTTIIQLEGFHIYTGSQILDANAINEAQKHTFKLLNDLASLTKHPVNIINVGGGFGIPYFTKHRPLDIKSVANNLNSLRSEITSTKYSSNLETILELGRYVVGESGVYICKVVDKKVSRDKTFVITDGGMHHHLAASGNLGQKVRKNFPIYVANRLHSDKTEKVTITGKLCTPLDILADDIEVSECKIGDYIAIMNSGAYSLSASPINFLGHPVAQEILV